MFFSEDKSVMDAVIQGAFVGINMISGIISTIIACVSLVAFLNDFLAWLGILAGIQNFTLEVNAEIENWITTPRDLNKSKDTKWNNKVFVTHFILHKCYGYLFDDVFLCVLFLSVPQKIFSYFMSVFSYSINSIKNVYIYINNLKLDWNSKIIFCQVNTCTLHLTVISLGKGLLNVFSKILHTS